MDVNRKRILFVSQAAIIAAVYVVLTIIFRPISFDYIQVRIAEALCVLPMFTPAAIPGLFIGCLLANFFGGAIVLDIIFGSIATLIGAIFTYILRKNRWLVPVPAIIANVLIVPFVLKYGYGIDLSIILLMFYILIGEVVGCYLLGELLISAINKNDNIFKNK